MTLFKKIDTTTGNFVEDVLLESRPFLYETVTEEIINEDETITIVETEQVVTDDKGNAVYDPQYIDVDVPQGFYLPKWNGGKWIEGGVAPDEIITESSLEERIQNLEETIITLTLF